MDANTHAVALEEKDGNVRGRQTRVAVAYFHAHAIEQVVAVRFDKNLLAACGNFAE